MAESLKTTKIYTAYMMEIKWRLAEIGNRITRARQQKKHLSQETIIMEIEFCYLQTRFVCELIALSALAGHHSYGLNKDLLKQHNADQIFLELEKINHLSFPVPVRVTRNETGNHHFETVQDLTLTRHELKTIYGRCGDCLHRGFLRHALKGQSKIYDGDALFGWFKSLLLMLNEHMIIFPQQQRVLLVNMSGGPNNEVVVHEGVADAPFVVSSPTPPSPRVATRKPRLRGKGN